MRKEECARFEHFTKGAIEQLGGSRDSAKKASASSTNKKNDRQLAKKKPYKKVRFQHSWNKTRQNSSNWWNSKETKFIQPWCLELLRGSVLIAEAFLPLSPRVFQNTKHKTGVCEEVFRSGKWSLVTGRIEQWRWEVHPRVYYRADHHWNSPDSIPLGTLWELSPCERKMGIWTHWLPSPVSQGIPQGPGMSMCVYVSEWLGSRLPRCSNRKVPGQKMRNTQCTL